MALTVVGCIHLIAKRKAIGPVELCTILRRVKHWFVEQVWVAPNQKALVSTIRVFTANLQVMKHVLEYIHRRLEHEKASVEVARVDENSAELPTLEQLVGVLEEDVIGINHDDTLVVNQGPRVKLVQRQLEPPVDPS